MRRSRSSIHKTPVRPNQPVGQRSASTQFPGDPETSEFYLRRVMDTMPGLVWSAFPDGGVEFCNQSWLDYTGLSLDKVRGRELAEAIHLQDKSDFREKWRAALRQGASFEAEARMRRADGSYRWFLIRAVPLRDASGAILRWYGTNADIEDLKRAQEDVLKQTSRLDELFEQTAEAVAVLNADGRVLRINKEFTRIFGYEPDEVLERPINDLIIPETLAKIAQEYRLRLMAGERVEVETVRRRKDGTDVYVSLLAVPVIAASGERVANYAIYRDITERKRAEERLFESEVRFQAIADTAPVMIWTTGTDALCNYFSKPWLEFTGRTMEQEVGMGWVEGVHPDDVQGCFDCFLTAFHARKPFRMEYRLRRADGEYRWVDESGIPRYTPGGEFAGYIGCNIDITDRKRAEEERRAHLWFLESMDKVNRAIQGTNDLEQMMSDVLDAVLSIFNSDRAWLVYPCDPEAPFWKVPMEHARPEFPGAFAVGFDLRMDPEIAKVFQTVRASNTPVRFGPGSEYPLPAQAATRFSIQSMMGMAVYPKGDKPYMLGLHQCSHPRIWTAQEERLFQEIGRRLEDALTSLLIFRNLSASERKLEEAQCLAHVGYWDRDLETDLITWSDETYRIFGVPVGEIVSFDRVRELIHAEDRPMVLEAVSAALRGGPRYDAEFRVVRPNGEVRIIHSQAHVTRDESGRARRMFGTVQDITERKRAEEELRAAETRFRMYVDHATDALFVHDESRKVVDVNRQACESLGYTREELIGMMPGDFDPALGLEEASIQPIMKERLNAGEVFSFETSHRRKDGTFFPVEVRVRPFWHGGHRFGLALVRDITERKRAEETLRQTEAELAHVARVATLGEMAASIAHEINQPLGAIVNNASACLRWLAGNNVDDARYCAELIRADAHRAAETLNRVRSFAKKVPPQKDWTDINQTIREVIELARSEVQRNGVALEMQLSDAVQSLVFADRVQLQQVILNLMMNAVEAISEMSDGPRQLLIRTNADPSGAIMVAVRDSGPGIAPENLDRLFTPFYTTKPQGMGMGLAISRSIIEAHGGRLWATANEDRGATFLFRLPTDAVRAS
jgi:PAS domain S-box-containing protein